MTNDEKLMQQALDALLGMGQKAADAMEGDAFHECHIVVSRLRARLAQPEPEPCTQEPANIEELYTAPPQREWQGLTDEERYLGDARSAEEIEYARAIEAKLKEKNNG